MRIALLAALAACGGSSRPASPPVVDHEVVADDEPEVRASCDPPPGRLRGCIVDEHGQGLAGVALVVVSPALPDKPTTLTDEHGGWAFDLAGTDFTLRVVYADLMTELALEVTDDTTGKLQPDIVLETSSW